VENFDLMKASLQSFLMRPGTLFFLGATGCLYLDAFILPHTPIYQGDTTPIWLLDATKMLEGQVMYRDFFEFTLPGTQVFFLLLFKWFGVRAWIPSATWVVLGISLAWMCVVISKQLLSGALVYLPGLLFLGLGFVTAPDTNHHWFSTLACLMAIAVLMAKRTPSRLAAAGALCGLATLFTSSRGCFTVAGFAAYLLWECRAKKLGWGWLAKAKMYLVIPFLATTLSVMAYLAWKVGLRLFVYCTVIFLLRYWYKNYWGSIYAYAADPPDFPFFWMEAPALLIWLFVHLMLPLIYILIFMQYRRRAKAHPEEPWDRIMLLGIVGSFLFLGIASSPIWLRLVSVLPPALILYVWLNKSPTKFFGKLRGVAWASGLLALVIQSVLVQTGWKGYIESPTGRAAILDPDRYAKYRWVLEHTHPGEFYFQADDCDQYFLLGLRNPVEVSFLTDSGFTRPEQVQNAIEMLEKHQVRFVMWAVRLDIPMNPGADGSANAPLRAYLSAHYHPVKTFDDQYEEAWERNP
jgi:hypothetical protein